MPVADVTSVTSSVIGYTPLFFCRRKDSKQNFHTTAEDK